MLKSKTISDIGVYNYVESIIFKILIFIVLMLPIENKLAAHCTLNASISNSYSSINHNTGFKESGTYDLFTRWGNRDYPIDMTDCTISADAFPSVPIITKIDSTSSESNDSITLNFPCTDDHLGSSLEFSNENGTTYPFPTADNVSSFTIKKTASGTHDPVEAKQSSCSLSNYGEIRGCRDGLVDYVVIIDYDPTGITDLTLTLGNFAPRVIDLTQESSPLEMLFRLQPGTVANYTGVGSGPLCNASFNGEANAGGCPEICDNGIDDDGDGLIDCADPDCVDALSQVTTSKVDEVCDQNGSITFTFSDTPDRTNIQFSIDGGATYPYDRPDNSGSFTVSLPAGTYDLFTRWGDESCPTDLTDRTIGVAAPLTCTADRVSYVGCNCQNNGSAISNVSGGTPPYSFLWSNGETTQQAVSLAEGNYTVTVTDSQNCQTTCTITMAIHPDCCFTIKHNGFLPSIGRGN